MNAWIDSSPLCNAREMKRGPSRAGGGGQASRKGTRASAAHRALAGYYYRKGDVDSLTQRRRSIRAPWKNSRTAPKPSTDSAWSRRSRAGSDEAIGYFKRAVQINPRFADALNNLGVAYEVKGEPNAAIASYRRALQADPNHALARKNLARFEKTKTH